MIPPDACLAFSTHADAAGQPVPPELARGSARRRLDYQAGRRAAAEALAGLKGRPAAVGRGPDGAPVWPDGIVGAISHAGGRAVALVGNAAHYAGLGVDLETIVARPDEIAPVLLTKAEAARLPHDALHITLAFSAKESLFKALYPTLRRFFGLEAAEVVSLDASGGVLRLCQPLGPWPNGARFGFGWAVIDGQVLTTLAAPHARRVAPPST
ncbi:4'-phosphopantetheinyl transferase family protein [Paracoccus sp. (in: a-proteobacteria)]|uniref:4'-phosphopantetheinyl transferase family protein n=1 Tax=Paracoccus sp. TaxID=267 RepID=UPI002AFFD618|nr:4'-phosphopantetheinyl transferase superfamily protein [Paracoccus sp. (in: a-proteobacteria)]